MTPTERAEWRGVAVLVDRKGRRFKGAGEVAVFRSGNRPGLIAFAVRGLLRKRAGTASMAAVRRAFPTPSGAEVHFEDGTVLELGGDSAVGFVLRLQAVEPSAGSTLSALSSLAGGWLAAAGQIEADVEESDDDEGD